MRRRDFIVCFFNTTATWPTAANAQKAPARLARRELADMLIGN